MARRIRTKPSARRRIGQVEPPKVDKPFLLDRIRPDLSWVVGYLECMAQGTDYRRVAELDIEEGAAVECWIQVFGPLHRESPTEAVFQHEVNPNEIVGLLTTGPCRERG